MRRTPAVKPRHLWDRRTWFAVIDYQPHPQTDHVYRLRMLGCEMYFSSMQGAEDTARQLYAERQGEERMAA